MALSVANDQRRGGRQIILVTDRELNRHGGTNRKQHRDFAPKTEILFLLTKIKSDGRFPTPRFGRKHQPDGILHFQPT